ncbi:MAG: AAA family ATPase [Anaerolineae bacterium]
MARRIIAGEPFPDGAAQPLPGRSVVYVDAESVPQILSERARLWQMDTSRLYLMQPAGKLYIDFGDPADRDHLVEMALHLDPALIVVDSLGSISSKGENNVEDVRDLLGFLNRLALDTQCGLLLIHHLRKRGVLPLVDVLTVDDFRGSSHIIAMSRSVLGLSIVQSGPEPDRNGPRRLEVIKTNLTRHPEPLGMTFKPLHPKGAWIEYSTEPPQPYRQPTKTEECSAWLVSLLEESGAARPQEIVEQAEAEGFSRRTVYRAREVLGEQVIDTEGYKHPENRWALAEGEGS